MKVLLVSANDHTEPYPVYPLGIDYVAGAIAPQHEVEIVDLNGGSEDALFERIDRFGPEVIGISLRNIDTTDTTRLKGFAAPFRELVAAIREHSSAVLVIGGSGFTIFPNEIIDRVDADYGIVGEGERLALLLQFLETGRDPLSIPGVVGRNRPGSIPPPWDRRIVRDIPGDSDRLRFYLRKGGMLNLQTKRGCNFRCIYCTYPHIEGKTLRRVPPDEVAETALRLQAAGGRYFFITDSAFNSDMAHSLAVAEAIRAAGVSIPWGAFFAPVRSPDGYFREMAGAGLTHVEFGTESMSDPVLRAYRKPFRAADVAAAHGDAVAAGLHVAHYLLLGGPGENSRTVEETLRRVEGLRRCVIFFFCGMRIYPHTALYDIALSEGQIRDGQNLLEPVFYRSPEIAPEEIAGRVRERAGGRIDWIVGAGGEETAKIVSRLYDRGFTGPLWEHLIR
jgi:radical SAM superfamily enzyme YgiQ (UPF0313 family)